MTCDNWLTILIFAPFIITLWIAAIGLAVMLYRDIWEGW